jgi:hypothetical protein
MAAATQSRRGSILANSPEGLPIAIGKNLAATKYLANTLGTLNADGRVIAYADGSQNEVVGFIKEELDYTDNINDEYNVELWSGVIVELVGSGLDDGDVGKEVYASDNQTVALTQSGTATKIGYIHRVISATRVLVYLDPSLKVA